MGTLVVILVALIALPAVGLESSTEGLSTRTPITITITSGRMEQSLESQTGAVSVLELSEKDRPGPASGLGELLDPVPGLFSASRFNGAQDLRLSVRGFGARGNFGIRGIRILLDGFPLTLPDGQRRGKRSHAVLRILGTESLLIWLPTEHAWRLDPSVADLAQAAAFADCVMLRLGPAPSG